MKKILIIIVGWSFFMLDCHGTVKTKFEGDALTVIHSPNPSNINKSEYFPKPFYPYTWYYKTEVRNNPDRDLKVIWFEGYVEANGHWYGSNVLNRTLRNDVFLKWYGDEKGDQAEEWIEPGKSRVCDSNWHGGYDPNGYRMKWAFIAIDRFGNDYYSESIIESVPIKADANK